MALLARVHASSRPESQGAHKGCSFQSPASTLTWVLISEQSALQQCVWRLRWQAEWPSFIFSPDRRPYFLEVHAEGPATVRVVAALAGGPAGLSPQPQQPDSAGSKEAPSAAEAAALSNGDVHGSAAAGSEAALAAEEAQPASELSSRDIGNRATPVHYFVMGPGAAWRSTSAWPPPELADKPYELFLGSGCAPLSSLAAEKATCGPGPRFQRALLSAAQERILC